MLLLQYLERFVKIAFHHSGQLVWRQVDAVIVLSCGKL
jgi:hypothetical protein